MGSGGRPPFSFSYPRETAILSKTHHGHHRHTRHTGGRETWVLCVHACYRKVQREQEERNCFRCVYERARVSVHVCMCAYVCARASSPQTLLHMRFVSGVRVRVCVCVWLSRRLVVLILFSAETHMNIRVLSAHCVRRSPAFRPARHCMCVCEDCVKNSITF